MAVSFAVNAQNRYWVGASGASWSAGANWSLTSGGAGGAGAPTSVQDAIFDNAFTGTVSYDAGTINLNSLSVISASSVTLSLAGSTGRIITCNNGGAVTNAFFIEGGSVLTMTTSTNSINFTLAFGSNSKGQINGTYIVAGVVAGGSGGRIDATSSFLTINGICRLNSGSSNFTGNTALNTFFNAGSVFEINKNGGSVPTASWNATSKVLVTGSNPVPPVFLGTSYGNLEVNAPLLAQPLYFNANISFNNVDLVNTGADVVRAKTGTGAVTYTTTINGNLTVSASSILETSGITTTSGNPGIIIVKGNIINNGIIRELGDAIGNQFILQGTANQNISGTGTYTGDDLDFILNNNAGATLLAAVTLPYRYSINAGNIALGNFNFTTPAVNQVGAASATANHVVTNGSGKLVIQNIGAGTVIFPIGASATTINPLAIFNGGGLNYGARVEIGINPAIAAPVKAVNRTWVVNPSGTPGSAVNVNFFYAAGDENASFSFVTTVELGFYTGVWNVINTGLTQFGSYQVSGTVNVFAANTDAPMVIGNIGAVLATGNGVSADYFTGLKQNGNHLLQWKLTCNSSPAVTMFLERSSNGVSYKTVFTEQASALRCRQPFSFTDDQPAAGVNYYRIKMIDADGKVSYSTVVTLINAIAGINVQDIAPNPVTTNSFHLKISAAKAQQARLVIADIQGRIVQENTVSLFAGFNTIPFDVAQLAKGSYQLYVKTDDGAMKVLRFVLQ